MQSHKRLLVRYVFANRTAFVMTNQQHQSTKQYYKILAVSTRPPDGVLLPPAALAARCSAPRLVTGAVIRRRFVIVR